MYLFIFSYLLIITGILVFETLAIKLFRQKRYTSILLFISLIATFVSLLVSFDALIGRVIVIIAYTAALIFALFDFFSKKISLQQYFKSNRTFLLFNTGLLLVAIIYRFYSFNFTYLFNGHDPYFFGIPFEILKADYHTRLKIFDNFPETWSSYHFFNGSASAILLFPSLVKDVFIYKASKLALVSLCLLSINEYLIIPKQNKQFAFILLLTLLSRSLSWYIYANGLLTLYFFLLFLITIKSENKALSILVLLFFCTSVSRSVVPGYMILAYIVFKEKKLVWNIFKERTVFYLVVVTVTILNVGSMFVGPPRLIYTPLIQKGFANFINEWSLLFSIRFAGIKFYSLLLTLFHKQFSFESILALIGLIVMIACVIITRKNIIRALYKREVLVCTILVLGGIFTGAVMTFKTQIDIIILCHLLMYAFMYKFIKSFVDKSYRDIVWLFLFASVIQVFLINPEAGVPNFVLIDWLIFLVLIEQAGIKSYFKKIGTGLTIASILIAFFLDLRYIILPRPVNSDSTSHPIKLNSPEFKDLAFINADIFEYLSPADSLNAAVASSIYGKRVKYYCNSSDRFSISKNFIGRTSSSNVK